MKEVKQGEIPEAANPSNSEVSEPFLRICAGAPAAVKDMQFALQKDEHGSYQKIPCEEVLPGFNLDDISAWRSLMIYMGGLTLDPDNPAKFSKIPNLVAAKRFGTAILERLGLYHSMKTALHSLTRTGNPMIVLAGYCHMMQQRDVMRDAFLKEEHHRDSIQWTILENPSLKSKAEYQVTKVRSLLIYNKSSCEANLYSRLIRQAMSISSLQIMRSSILSSSSRTSKSPI
jgi:hypothetical protein